MLSLEISKIQFFKVTAKTMILVSMQLEIRFCVLKSRQSLWIQKFSLCSCPASSTFILLLGTLLVSLKDFIWAWKGRCVCRLTIKCCVDGAQAELRLLKGKRILLSVPVSENQ